MYKVILWAKGQLIAWVSVEDVADVSIQIQQGIPVKPWQEIAGEAEVAIAKLIEESTARHLADFKYDNALRAAKMDIAIPHKLTQDAMRDLYRSAVQRAWRGLDADCFNSYNQDLGQQNILGNF